MFLRMKIKKKLILTLILVSFLNSVLGWIAIQVMFQVYDEQIYNESADKFHLYSDVMTEKMQMITDLSYSIFSDDVIQENLVNVKRDATSYDSFLSVKEIQEKLFLYLFSQKFVESIEILDGNDNQYGVGISRITYSPADKQEIRSLALASSGDIVWSDTIHHDPTVIAIREIRQTSELNLQSLGVLVIRINLEKMISALERRSIGQRSQMLILSDERVIYPYDSTTIRSDIGDISPDKLYQIQELEGSKWFLTQSDFPYSNWKLVNKVSYDSIVSRGNQIKNFMAGTYVIVFFVVLWVGMRVSREITTPIEQLTLKIKAAGNGVLDQSDERIVIENRDEIGKLNRDFDRMLEKINALVKDNYHKQLMFQESEFRALQASINPHFLYNTLESINWLAKINKQDQISSMVKALGDLLRSSISRGETILVKDEMKMLDHYLLLQKYRYEERLNVDIHVDDGLESCIIPKFVLQPLVENAIQYGTEGETGKCDITIRFLQIGSLLELSVTDTGPGMDPNYLVKRDMGQAEPQGTGIGLRQIEERVKALCGQSSALIIEAGPEGRGTRIIIRFSQVERGDMHEPI